MICKAFLLVMNDVSQYKIILVINIVSHNFVDVPQQYHSYIQRKIKFLFILSLLHFHFRVSTSPFYHSIILKVFFFLGRVSQALLCCVRGRGRVQHPISSDGGARHGGWSRVHVHGPGAYSCLPAVTDCGPRSWQRSQTYSFILICNLNTYFACLVEKWFCFVF